MRDVETLQLRPLNAVGVLSEAWAVMRLRFGSLAAVALVLPAPASALLSLLIEFPPPPGDQASLEEVTEWMAETAPVVGFHFLVTALVSVVAAAAAFRLTAEAYAGMNRGWRPSLTAAFSRLLPILGLFALTLPAVILGSILFILPGLFLIVSWAVWPGPMAVENQGIRGSLRRSWRLVHSRWWHVFGAAAAAFAIAAVMGTAAAALPTLFIPGRLFAILWSAVIGSFFEMFLFTALAVAYLELRVRNEGLDAERLSLELRATAPD